MLLAAAPWFVAIGIATEGRFFAEAVGGDMLAKVGSGEEKHWGPPGYYLLTFAVAAFPGAFDRAAGAARRRGATATVAATRFLLAWVVPSWLLFEAVQTKLPHYTLPLFPALMLLGAAWAMDPLRRMPARRWWRAAALAALVLVALGIGVAALAAPWFSAPRWCPGERSLVLPAALLLLWVVLRAARRGDYGRAAMLGAPCSPCCPTPPRWKAWRRASSRSGSRRASRRLLAERAPDLPASDFGITGHAEPSVRVRGRHRHAPPAHRRRRGALPGRGARPGGGGRQPRRGRFPARGGGARARAAGNRHRHRPQLHPRQMDHA